MNGLANASPRDETRGDDLAWVAKQARAHTMVTKAIRDGRLTRQPCEVCGAGKVDAHHDDYDKPLEVRWLCRLHHHHLHLQDPRKPQLGIVTLRSLRDRLPDEPTYIVKWENSVREVVGVWIPADWVDAQ